MIIINICRDFTETPGARYKSEGEFSGEEFRDDLLKHKIIDEKDVAEYFDLGITKYIEKNDLNSKKIGYIKEPLYYYIIH